MIKILNSEQEMIEAAKNAYESVLFEINEQYKDKAKPKFLKASIKTKFLQSDLENYHELNIAFEIEDDEERVLWAEIGLDSENYNDSYIDELYEDDKKSIMNIIENGGTV